MPEILVVDLFVEDRAHEAFLDALIRRLLSEGNQEAKISLRSPLGGHGKMLTELKAYQKAVQGHQPGLHTPDILVVTRDTNCERFARARQTVADEIDQTVFPAFAIACPDPHIERWYLADPVSFQHVVGTDPRLGRRRCKADLYKRRLADAVRRGGHPPTLGGIEFARDLIEEMDLYRAGTNESSLQHFIGDFRQAIVLITKQR